MYRIAPMIGADRHIFIDFNNTYFLCDSPFL
jgi:hypothetical protein